MSTMMNHMSTSRKRAGFTIVELLVVIVVLAILVSITVIAYNGVASRAHDNQLAGDATQAATQLQLDKTTSGEVYPASTADANGGKGLKASGGDVYQYTVDNVTMPPSYCLSVTNPGFSNTYYISSSTGRPAKGLCAGHVQSPSANSLTPPANTTNITMTVPSSATTNMAYTSTINISTSVTGLPSPTVQWQRLTPINTDTGTWVDLSGYTGTSLAYPFYQGGSFVYTAGDSGYFRIKCTNSSGTAYSAAIYVTLVDSGD